MKIAALDLGSNTFLLLIVELQDGQITNVYEDRVTLTRLGQGVNESRSFHPDALARVDRCFEDYSAIIKAHNVDEIVAVATSAARDVNNKEEFFELGKKWGIPIHVIPGELEAKLTFIGSTFDQVEGNQAGQGLAVIDVGGGSTEVNVDGRGVSVDVGSVRLTEMFLPNHPVSKNQLETMQTYLRKQFLEKLKNTDVSSGQKLMPKSVQKVIAVAGTPTTLACLAQESDFDASKVHGFSLSMQEMRSWLSSLAGMSVEERQQLKGLEPKRADVIVAGTAILLAASEALGVEKIFVSTKGVRYGVALCWQDIVSAGSSGTI